MIVVVRQQTPTDCGIAALASIAPVPYDDALAAVRAAAPAWRGLGLTNQQLVAAAQQLDLALTPYRRYDLDAVDLGVLRLHAPHAWRGGHFVACYRGLIIDPATGAVQPWRDYRKAVDARFATLLAVEPAR